MSSVLGAELPPSWSAAPLKHVTALLNRGSAPNYAETGSVRAISQAANQAGGLDWTRTRFHDFSGDPRNLKGFLLPDDVLINSTGRGTLGRVGYFSAAPDPYPCMADGHVTVARTRHDALDPRFAYYWLGSRPLQEYVYAALIVGATNQIELNRDRLGEAPVPLPPLAEQRRIADFLDGETARIDDLRRLTRQQAALLGDRFVALMLRETTVGNGRVAGTGVSWMPEINEDWQLLKVSHCFRTSSGTTPASTGADYFGGPYPWVNSSEVKDGPIDRIEKSVTGKALHDFPALKVHPAGSLVVALYGQGSTKGRVGILGLDATLNQACCALIPHGRVSTEFASYWFRAHKTGITAQAVGAGQPNLSQDLIRQLRIPAPDRAEQRRIVDILRTAEHAHTQHVALLNARDTLLTERRHALITAAVTGRLDASTAAGAA